MSRLSAPRPSTSKRCNSARTFSCPGREASSETTFSSSSGVGIGGPPGSEQVRTVCPGNRRLGAQPADCPSARQPSAVRARGAFKTRGLPALEPVRLGWTRRRERGRPSMGAYKERLTGGRLAWIGYWNAAPSRWAQDPSRLSTSWSAEADHPRFVFRFRRRKTRGWSAFADHDAVGTVRFEPDTPRRVPERLSASRPSTFLCKPPSIRPLRRLLRMRGFFRPPLSPPSS